MTIRIDIIEAGATRLLRQSRRCQHRNDRIRIEAAGTTTEARSREYETLNRAAFKAIIADIDKSNLHEEELAERMSHILDGTYGKIAGKQGLTWMFAREHE